MLVEVLSSRADAPMPDFPVASLRRLDSADPEFSTRLAAIWDGLKIAAPFTRPKFDARYWLSNAQILVSLEVAPAQAEAFERWVESIGGLVAHPDGALRDRAGRLLLGLGDAPADADAAWPPATDALRRKHRTEDALAARGLETFQGLPVVEGENEVRLRPAGEVARRCLALIVVAVRGESLGAGEPLAVSVLKKRAPLAFPALSPEERRFMSAGEWLKRPPTAQQITNATWRYEALATLLWALGEIETLPWPGSLCDVPAIAAKMLDLNAKSFIQTARLRPAAEILDALDEIYRLRWILVEARLGNRPHPDDVDAGVAVERHHALNWLTCYSDADWDDVSTDT
jgi:hypothetical protein